MSIYLSHPNVVNMFVFLYYWDTFFIPFMNLSRLGDQIQADICVIIAHNDERLHLAGHLLAAEKNVRLIMAVV